MIVLTRRYYSGGFEKSEFILQGIDRRSGSLAMVEVFFFVCFVLNDDDDDDDDG